MKHPSIPSHLTLYTPREPQYPNAADQRYLRQKAVNVVTAIVSGLGFISAMLFLVTL